MDDKLIDLPVQGRAASVRPETVDDEARTFEVLFTTGAAVKRWSWSDGEVEESLEVSPQAMDLTRLVAGAPFLNSHNSYELEHILGVVEAVRIDGGAAFATIRMSDRDEVQPIWSDIRSGIIRNVSVGYSVERYEVTREDGKRPHYRAVAWTPMEISAVAIPADAGAQIRGSAPGSATKPCAVTSRAAPAASAASHEEAMMADENQAPAAGNDAVITTPAAAPDAMTAERARSAGILSLFQRHGLTDKAPKAIEDGMTLDQARAAVLDHLAAQTAPAGARAEPVLGRGLDETETRRRGMEEALTAALTARPVGDLGRAYAGMDLLDLAAERMGERRVPGSFGAREELLKRAFHTTSDFPMLFENALNKGLQARYAMQEPTYRRVAKRRTYVDFRPHTSIRVGDFPQLQAVTQEAGEIRTGTFSEARERTSVTPYGVRVNLSRTMLINDGLGGIQQVLNDRGSAVARFEDATFYAMAFGGAGSNGPTLLETGRQVFNTTDGTLAGTAAAITIPSITLGRAALLKRKSLDGADLELMPAVLLVGPDKLTEAQQLLAPIQAQQSGNVNPFSGLMEVAVTAKITGNAWYVFADPDVAPVFEWGLLEGYEAPRFRIEDVFGTQGTSLTLEHDFGCGAIDWRGGYRNAGA
jgi:hypothetical protein